MLNNLEEKIIKKIKKDKIKPLSYSFFVFKKTIFWLMVSSFLILAGLSLSVMFLIIKHGDWDIYRFLNHSPVAFFFKAFPYFWLLGVLLFLILAFIKTKKADGTYNYSFIFKGVIGLIIIIFFSFIFYFSGLSQKTETTLSNSKIYRKANYLRSSWENPQRGLLAGVLAITNNGDLILNDFSDQQWLLILLNDDFAGKNLLIDKNKIKIIGQIDDMEAKRFIVHEVRSWECGCPHCAKIEGSCSNCSKGHNNCSKDNFCGN